MPQTDLQEFLHTVFPSREGVPEHLSFRDYMDCCLFDESAGYYRTGRVSFGLGHDFWTFPQRMSPTFGTMLAERVLDLWRVIQSEVVAVGAKFSLVEVGGGMGQLLADTVRCLDQRAKSDPNIQELIAHLDPIAVDRSPALLDEQNKHKQATRARFIQADATDLAQVLPTPFFGLVFANELFDAMAVDAVQVTAEGHRSLSVLPWLRADHTDLCGPEVDDPASGLAGFYPLLVQNLPTLMERLQADRQALERFASGEDVRWTGILEPVSEPETITYLSDSEDVLVPSQVTQNRPVWVTFPTGMVPALDGIRTLLSDGKGAFVTVDYGGISKHIFDNDCRYPHLRTYCQALDGNTARDDEPADKVHDPFRAPGCEDITTDIDFTWIGQFFEAQGIDAAFYGHQSALETGLDLWKKPHQNQLIEGRRSEGFDGMDALKEAFKLLRRFRFGGGFHVIAVTSSGLASAFSGLGPADPLFEEPGRFSVDLDTGALREGIVAALREEGFTDSRPDEWADKILEALHPSGSVIDDLGDVGHYRWRELVLSELDELSQRKQRKQS